MARVDWKSQLLTTSQVKALIARYRSLMGYLGLGHWQHGTIKGDMIEVGTGGKIVMTATRTPKKWRVITAYFVK